ncbi:barstar family protein [Orrella marina]|uniref:Barstar family protein 2 n=1 Tax=Orrella marina TaxID=2163011 RepID=A0A2R4XIM6_9BURK|nr:barstar family protein [Orrella marina]AWB33672.1 barstar family protein 2 [Orrella marina]
MVNSIDKQVQKLISQGGEFDGQSDLDAVKASLEGAEIACYRADCSKARNRSAVFRAVVKAVDYPEFFGSSFDGLYDCLNDTVADQRVGVGILLDDLHSADPDLEKDMSRLVDVLNEVADHARDQGKVFVFGIKHGGKHPEAVPGVVHNWSETPS